MGPSAFLTHATSHDPLLDLQDGGQSHYRGIETAYIIQSVYLSILWQSQVRSQAGALKLMQKSFMT